MRWLATPDLVAILRPVMPITADPAATPDAATTNLRRSNPSIVVGSGDGWRGVSACVGRTVLVRTKRDRNHTRVSAATAPPTRLGATAYHGRSSASRLRRVGTDKPEQGDADHRELPSAGQRDDSDDGCVHNEDRANTSEERLLVFGAEPLDRKFFDGVRHPVHNSVTHVENGRLKRVREDRNHFGRSEACHGGREAECDAEYQATELARPGTRPGIWGYVPIGR